MNWTRLFLLLLLTVPFAKGATLSGTVVDPSGGVIRNATIIIHWDPIGLEGVAENVGSKNDKVGVSDAVGHFSLELPPGVYDIFLSAGGFSPHCEKLSLRKNETRLYTVQLKVSRTLTVKVD